MRKVDWEKFNNDDEILEYLKKLPRYKNTPLKSLFIRAYFFLKVLFCRTFNINKPIFIVLATNDSCNIKCKYCYGSYGEQRAKDWSTKEILSIIDELKALGAGYLTLHGGESLLRRDMGEVFNYAKHKGFFVTFNTNGYLVPKKIDEIKCIDNVCISLDGREENNDKTRGQGCYKKVMDAIDVVVKNNLPCVLHCTITNYNKDDMEFLANLAQEKKCRLQYSILYNTGEMEEKCPDLLISSDDVRKTVEKIIELKRKGYPVYYSENVLETALKWPFDYDKKRCLMKDDDVKDYKKHLIDCYHGKLKYQIDSDGRVVTCWAHNYKTSPSLKEHGLKKAIELCSKQNDCRHCAFLANNEHNALLGLSLKTVLNIMSIQIKDSLKFK